MAELISQEKLQPSLLDRLTDEEPEKKREARDRRVLSLKRLREGVLRDLAWLLNSTNLASVTDLSAYPEVEKSVLNYGIPELAGTTASGLDIDGVQGLLRQAIAQYEPRILPHSVSINVAVDAEDMSHNALHLEIKGELWAQPVPERLFLKTEVDLETGSINVSDYSGPSTPSQTDSSKGGTK